MSGWRGMFFLFIGASLLAVAGLWQLFAGTGQRWSNRAFLVVVQGWLDALPALVGGWLATLNVGWAALILAFLGFLAASRLYRQHRARSIAVSLDSPDAGIGGEEDALSFSAAAEQLADAMVGGEAEGTRVVGVVGSWGAGKTKLIRMARKAAARRPQAQWPHIVEFSPWLIKSHEQMLPSLFEQIMGGLDRIGKAFPLARDTVEQARTDLRHLMTSLAPLADILVDAGDTLHPTLGKTIKYLQALPRKQKEGPTVEQTKRRIAERLRGLPVRLVCVIDDLDRLHPDEMVEVMRLVRSVADFPNMTYVLAYDQTVLAKGIQTACRVEDGNRYLEKIINTTVRVPSPELYNLFDWFIHLLLHRRIVRDDGDIAELIGCNIGEPFATPRAVLQTLDAVEAALKAIGKKVENNALIWLQILRINYLDLYLWAFEYLKIHHTFAKNVDPNAKRIMASNFKTLAEFHNMNGNLLGSFGKFLPGFSLEFNFRPEDLFNNDPPLSAHAYRDLRSTDHFMVYFNLHPPINATSDGDFLELQDALALGDDKTQALFDMWQGLWTNPGYCKLERVFKLLGERPEYRGELTTTETIAVLLRNIIRYAIRAEETAPMQSAPFKEALEVLIRLLHAHDTRAVEIYEAMQAGLATPRLRQQARARIATALDQQPGKLLKLRQHIAGR
ncbi:KAP family P-loop NTPase fold protein [Niveispirillum sp. KHB5.9]|uniref:KAP family P-loop NTPase fold protein n=1 Tax=Niveispirillum sp. KHB5.9 TaxID=3400269 RepID=UPI003A8A0A81